MNKFSWDGAPDWFQAVVEDEIFNKKIYERFFEVNEGDIVLDLGASVGPFVYSILHKNPKHVICIEPSSTQFKTLVENTMYGNVTCINKFISYDEKIVNSTAIYGFEGIPTETYSISFNKIIDLYNLDHIDFIKTDCEEGEYSVFTVENLIWIKQNVKKIAGEWHLGNYETKQKFKEFRDVYLRVFPKYEIFSVDGVNIKELIWSEDFINYYEQIIIYIDNRDKI
jgi:FkbM family methyltransferase